MPHYGSQPETRFLNPYGKLIQKYKTCSWEESDIIEGIEIVKVLESAGERFIELFENDNEDRKFIKKFVLNQFSKDKYPEYWI